MRTLRLIGRVVRVAFYQVYSGENVVKSGDNFVIARKKEL